MQVYTGRFKLFLNLFLLIIQVKLKSCLRLKR